MRTDFIYIDDPSQIDTSKTTVYDLNKRYIDSRGNLYGLKYNRQNRKVEVVRLLRTTSDRAGTIRSRMLESRRNAKHHPSLSPSPAIDIDDAERQSMGDIDNELNSFDEKTNDSLEYVDETDITDNLTDSDHYEADDGPDEPFSPDRFVQILFESVKLHKERFSTITSNISKAQVISHQDRQNHNDFEDLKRTLEIEAYKKVDEISTIQKELQEYPRPVSYYIPRLSRPAQRTLQVIASEKTKLKFILLCEINDYFKEVYKTFLSIIDRYQEMIARVGTFEEKVKVTQRKQFLQDAATTLVNTRKDVQQLLEKLRSFEEYLNDTKNFT